jgi:hypothetical protein
VVVFAKTLGNAAILIAWRAPNNRLLDIAEDKVTFRYKDYRHDAQHRTMTLEAGEFIRRFLLMYFLRAFSASATYGSKKLQFDEVARHALLCEATLSSFRAT